MTEKKSQVSKSEQHLQRGVGETRPDIRRRVTNSKAPMVVLGDGQLVSLPVGASVDVKQPQVDFCFVFDTTASMSDKIDGLVNCMTGFIDQLATLQLDWRSTCVPFGDLTVGDRIITNLPFVTKAEDAKKQFRTMERFSGGGNDGESSIQAMKAGIEMPWRQKAVKVVVLLTDEPAHDVHLSPNIDRQLDSQEAICFVASPRLEYFQTWATTHGGRWFEIGPYMDTDALLNLLRSLVRDIAEVAHEVHMLTQGSVRTYLELPAESRRALRS